MSDLLLFGGGSPSVGVSGPGTSTLFVEFAFGGSWRVGVDDLTWSDETVSVMYEQRCSTRRGRQSERDRTVTGSLSCALLNSDRRFDPTYVDGPYYGMLVPGVPVRFLNDMGGLAPEPVGYGFVQEWPQGYSHGDRANTVAIEAFDWFEMAATMPLQGVLRSALLVNNPTALWMMDETGGDVMVDSSGNGNHGVYQNVTLGADPVAAASQRSVTIGHTESARARFNGPLVNAYPFTVEAWVRILSAPDQAKVLFWGSKDTSRTNRLMVIVLDTLSGGSGEVTIRLVVGNVVVGEVTGTRRIDDGKPHHVAVRFVSASSWVLVIDGVVDATTGSAAAIPSGWTFWSVGNFYANNKGDFGLGGEIAAVAVYPTALTVAQIAEHHTAGADAWDGDTVGERVARVLDQVGFPANDRQIGETWTRLGPAVLEGVTVGEYLSRLEATEQGRIFMGRNGWVFVQGRYNEPVLAGAFADDGTGQSPYRDVKLNQPKAMLHGKVTVTADGAAPVTVEDPAAIDGAGDNALTIDAPLFQAPAQQRSLGEYVLSRSSRPQTRLEGLSVPVHRDGFDTIALFAVGLDLGDQVGFTRTLPVGDPIVLTQIIEGVSHTFNTKEWVTSVNLSPADTTSWFRIGSSLIAGPDLIAY